MTKVDWIAGPPPGQGRWWIVWQADRGPGILAVEISPALHHCISSAAALLNWHAHLTGARTAMRPGISPPEDVR